MNPGVFQGAGTGTSLGTISRYIQTPPITSSQTIQVPAGTQRIEALLCGGGGGGGNSERNGGGGFGGLAVFAIPVTGQPLVVTIGAGGSGSTVTPSASAGAGSPTYITSGKTIYALIGGGGGGGTGNTNVNGLSGGGGGGASNNTPPGGDGGAAPLGQVLWSANNPLGITAQQRQLVQTVSVTGGEGYNLLTFVPLTTGAGGGGLAGSGSSFYETYSPYYFTITVRNAAQYGANGGGNGAAGYFYTPSPGNTFANAGLFGAGASGSSYGAGLAGGGGGGGSGSWNYPGYATSAGGSLTSLSVWGLTGFAGGAGSFYGGGASGSGGGGGGMLAVGSAGAYTAAGGAGGNGGGGGGAGGYNQVAGQSYNGGAGGNGFAVIRFYL